MTSNTTLPPADAGRRLSEELGGLVTERASACGLTECAGKPMCARCLRQADMDALCGLLPEGAHWGDPLTPELLRELLAAKAQQAEAWLFRLTIYGEPPNRCR